MDSVPVTAVQIDALHDQHDLRIELRPGLNILYGKNGTGKTTFLHILANLLDRDIGRFGYLRFAHIQVETAAGTRIDIWQERGAHAAVHVAVDGVQYAPVARGQQTPPELREVLRSRLGGRPVYLPAFRSVLEAISQNRTAVSEAQREADFKQIIETEQAETTDDLKRARNPYLVRESSRAVAYKSVLCREWFGPFVPVVRFPSLWEVSEQLVAELQQAQLAVASTDREAFSGVFVQVLRAVLAHGNTTDTGDVQSLLGSIRNNLNNLQEATAGVPEVYQQIASMVSDQSRYPTKEEAIAARILGVYDRALKERSDAQKRAFQQIRTFEESVNRFLSGKRLAVRVDETHHYQVRSQHARMISLADGRRAGLSMLSSGERHVLTLLFSATHMSTTDGILLIDEPELSLHVGWQRIILDELMKQAGNRQIIACTHAPEVAARHRQVMVELAPRMVQGPNMGDEFGIPDDAVLVD